MKLNELSPSKGTLQSRKRLGRGVGSRGSTSGRGHKGQNARSGGGVRIGFEGGQMPLHRRLPKRGFHNIFKKKFAILNVKDLAKFEKDSVIDESALIKAGLVKGKYDGIKILGNGNIDFSLVIKSNACVLSNSAKEKIESAGGKIEG